MVVLDLLVYHLQAVQELPLFLRLTCIKKLALQLTTWGLAVPLTKQIGSPLRQFRDDERVNLHQACAFDKIIQLPQCRVPGESLDVLKKEFRLEFKSVTAVLSLYSSFRRSLVTKYTACCRPPTRTRTTSTSSRKGRSQCPIP